jgi:hypothetical protein
MFYNITLFIFTHELKKNKIKMSKIENVVKIQYSWSSAVGRKSEKYLEPCYCEFLKSLKEFELYFISTDNTMESFEKGSQFLTRCGMNRFRRRGTVLIKYSYAHHSCRIFILCIKNGRTCCMSKLGDIYPSTHSILSKF